MNKGYVYIDKMRSTWIDYNKVVNQSFFTILASLITLFSMFFNFFIHVDSLYKNDFIMNLPIKMVDFLVDESNMAIVGANFYEHMNLLVMLTATIPGADCRSIGYRFGTYIRKVFGLTYD